MGEHKLRNCVIMVMRLLCRFYEEEEEEREEEGNMERKKWWRWRNELLYTHEILMKL